MNKLNDVSKTCEKKLVSVLILSYNHSTFILDAIQSAYRQKTHGIDIEIIVCDDGSTDGTQEILRKVQQDFNGSLRLILKEHKGVHAIAQNFNTLIADARGDYIAFLASDDRFADGRFTDQIMLMEKDESLKVVYGNGKNIRNNKLGLLCTTGKTLEVMNTGNLQEIYKFLTTSIPLLYIQSVLAESSFLKTFQAFDESLIADDWVFNIRVVQKLLEHEYKLAFIDKTLFYRNMHGQNTSDNHFVHIKRIEQVVNKYFKGNEKKRFLRKLYFEYSLIGMKTGNIHLFRKSMFQYLWADPLLTTLIAFLTKRLERLY
jgi:glycosyltransferase involved in cell wall biosynthesis